ncbi:hypothetical protein DENSPDRAFT_886674 [Dentipellis sp. KUC8613]|nr:hypothetical protein DENSPDRAFT_886674 [Dentipellis sp. KUC8613]
MHINGAVSRHSRALALPAAPSPAVAHPRAPSCAVTRPPSPFSHSLCAPSRHRHAPSRHRRSPPSRTAVPALAPPRPRIPSRPVMRPPSPLSRHRPVVMRRCAFAFAATRSCAAVTRPVPPSRASRSSRPLPARHPPLLHTPTPPFRAVPRRLAALLRPLLPLDPLITASRHATSPRRALAPHGAMLRVVVPCCAAPHRLDRRLPVSRPRHALALHGAVLRPTTPSRAPRNPPAPSYVAAPRSAAPRRLDLRPFASRPVALSRAPSRRVTPSCTPQWLQYCNFSQCCLSCYCLSK